MPQRDGARRGRAKSEHGFMRDQAYTAYFSSQIGKRIVLSARIALNRLRFQSRVQTIKTKERAMSVEISRGQYTGWTKRAWPNKDQIIDDLTRAADILSRDWPPYPVGAVRNLWVNFGRKVERAQNSEECVDAFFHVLQYLVCPEPGWEGVELKIVN